MANRAGGEGDTDTDSDAEVAHRHADIQRYLQHVTVERRLAPRSIALISQALARLEQAATAEGLAPEAVQAHHIRRWLSRLHQQGLSPRSLALILSAWRGLYRWLGREGRIRANPVEGVRAPKAAKPLPKALPVDQAVALAAFEAPPRPNVKAGGREAAVEAALRLRDHAIVELLYGSGLRVAELVGLDVQASDAAAGWVDTADATAHVLGKGRKRRSVPVGAPSLQALQAWRQARDTIAAVGEPALFVSQRGTRLSDGQLRQRLKALALKAGLPTSVHPHMLRHSFASHVLQSSGDLRAVQQLLGHADIRTTQVYTRLDFQHLAQAYDAAHPRARRKG